MKTPLRSLFLHSCLLLLLTSAGCAFGARKIALVYEPVGPPAVSSGKGVAVAKFQDVRQDKEEVGEVRNGFFMKTASVVISGQDAGGWIANALSQELERSGVRVTKIADPALTRDPVVIQGSLTEFYTRMSAFSFRCNIRADVQVTRAGVPVLNKQFLGQARKTPLFASTSEYEEVSKEALQNLLKQLVPEILAQI